MQEPAADESSAGGPADSSMGKGAAGTPLVQTGLARVRPQQTTTPHPPRLGGSAPAQHSTPPRRPPWGGTEARRGGTPSPPVRPGCSGTTPRRRTCLGAHPDQRGPRKGCPRPRLSPALTAAPPSKWRPASSVAQTPTTATWGRSPGPWQSAPTPRPRSRGPDAQSQGGGRAPDHWRRAVELELELIQTHMTQKPMR